MNVEVVMPKMGESIQEGKVLRWVKKVGDIVERDEVILEISTDKVDTEVPSPSAGKIIQLRANENDTVEVGKVIAIISTDTTAEATPLGATSGEATVGTATSREAIASYVGAPLGVAPLGVAPLGVAASAVDVVMPKMGESIQEGKVLRWVKKVGDKVERDEVLLEISTDKVDTEVPAPNDGILTAIFAQEGDVVEVGKIIAQIGTISSSVIAAPAVAAPAVAAPAVAAPAAAAPAVASPVVSPLVGVASGNGVPRTSGGRFYSPLVRSIAAAEGVAVAELDALSGSGLEGRVTKNDILGFLSNRDRSPAQRATVSAPSAAKTDALPTTNLFVGADDEVIPMNRVRVLIAEHMVRSVSTSPHVTSVAEADVTNLVKLREKMKGAFEKREGFKLTYTPFFGVACAEGVKQWPMINISVDGTNIIRHRRVHLGMATATPDGNLIVPVIKNAEVLNVTGMARSMNDLAQKARIKKLSPDDISGGTITITNVGSFGSLFGSPVINQPQCAIMGIGAIQKRPVVRTYNGEDVIVVRSMVYLSLTYDHRVIDGALATQALASMCKALEMMSEETVNL